MTITVNTSTRSAAFSAPAVFSAGEATPISIVGLSGHALATLKLAAYLTDGTLLALCSTWTEGESVVTGTLDTRTPAVATAFQDARPDAREPIVVCLGDAARPWFVQCSEMINNPLWSEPVAPDPSPRYLVAADFAALADPGADPTFDALVAAYRGLLAKLKDPDA